MNPFIKSLLKASTYLGILALILLTTLASQAKTESVKQADLTSAKVFLTDEKVNLLSQINDCVETGGCEVDYFKELVSEVKKTQSGNNEKLALGDWSTEGCGYCWKSYFSCTLNCGSCHKTFFDCD